MSSQITSHHPNGNWIFQKAEIKSRSPAPSVTGQSPATRPFVSSQIFGSDSLGKSNYSFSRPTIILIDEATPLGKRASSEVQLERKSLDNDYNQDRKRPLSVSGKKRCSNCGDELGKNLQ